MGRPVPGLGLLLGRALRPVILTLGLWTLLALLTFWGTPRASLRDAFALAYNDNAFLGLLLGASLAFGSLQIIARLLPPVGAALGSAGRFLASPLRRLPVYTRRQLGTLARFAFGAVVAFWIVAQVRQGPTWAMFKSGLAGIPVQLPAWLMQSALMLVFFVLQFVVLLMVLSRGGVHVYLPEEISTNFDSVWGQDAVLEKVKEAVTFLKDPDEIERRGGHVPGGILLYGPPGTGKTLLAEAVAGETSTPFVMVEPGAFQAMFVGIGVLKVRTLYRKLRKLAEAYGGVVVFFDEADVLGSRPGTERSSATSGAVPEPVVPDRQRAVMGMGGDLGVLNAVLASMQGLRTPKGLLPRIRRMFGLPAGQPPRYRIMHMMATNLPSSLDPALLRPGRIDRIFRVGYPSRVGRLRTFQGYLAKVEHDLTDAQLEELATMTVNATGAVIKDIVNEALIASMRAGRERITWVDVLNAKRLKEFGPPEGVEYVPFERHAVAIHESSHALVAYRLRSHLTIDTVTIEKGQDYLGMVSSTPSEDLYTRWRSQYRTDIAVALSSLAGERLFFDGDSTSGVSADLEQATRLATLMTGRWGMADRIGADIAPDQGGTREEVEELLQEIFAEVTGILTRERTLVLALAHALECERTLTGPDVRAVFELRPGLSLDGRIYDGDHAAAVLEEYHETVLASRGEEAPILTPEQVRERLQVTFTPGPWPEPRLPQVTSEETSVSEETLEIPESGEESPAGE